MAIPHNEDQSTARFWKAITGTSTPQLGAAFAVSDIEGSNGRACRGLKMLEAGELHVLNADGVDCSIPVSLDKGEELILEVGTIKAEQSAAILLIW